MSTDANSDRLLAAQIEDELRNCNAALQRLGALLSTTGVDPEVLLEFRESVNRVRVSAWAAQKAIVDREGMTFERLLAGERVRSIAKMCEQLSEYVGSHGAEDCPDFERILEEFTKLMVLINLRSTESASGNLIEATLQPKE